MSKAGEMGCGSDIHVTSRVAKKVQGLYLYQATNEQSKYPNCHVCGCLKIVPGIPHCHFQQRLAYMYHNLVS